MDFDSSPASGNPGDLKNMMNEMEKLKIFINKSELQLYEANEKISELEDENLELKSKNKELNDLAKIMTANIQENIGAHKMLVKMQINFRKFPIPNNFRMQESFKLVKDQRDELIMRNRDSIDSPKSLTVNEEIRDLKTELKRQKAVYEAQFIEYVSSFK